VTGLTSIQTKNEEVDDTLSAATLKIKYNISSLFYLPGSILLLR
jgi:hypothetical protein